MDWNKLQKTLYSIEPSSITEDYSKLKSMATGSQLPTENNNIDHLNESMQVAEGSLKMDRDYSVNDFAKLAGVVLKEDATTSEGVGSAFVQGIKRGYNGDRSGSYAEPVDVEPEKKSASSSKRNPIRLAKAINGTDDQMLMRAINKIQTGTDLSRTEMIRITEAFKQILNMDRSQLRILMSALSQNAPQQTSQSSQNEEDASINKNVNTEDNETLMKESLSLIRLYAGIKDK